MFYSAVLLATLAALSAAKCPNISADKLYPCYCLHDTNEIYCRGGEDRTIDDKVLERVTKSIVDNSPDPNSRTFKKLTISQSDVTVIGDTLFKDLMFEELAIRYNFRLRSISADAFASSRTLLKNVSFGEVNTFYEIKTTEPFKLDFLKNLKLDNLFLNGLNIGQLEESLFKPLLMGKDGQPSMTKFFLSSMFFDCSCKIKWIYELDMDQRRPLFGQLVMFMGPRDTAPLSCHHEGLGTYVPLRALSKADFSNC